MLSKRDTDSEKLYFLGTARVKSENLYAREFNIIIIIPCLYPHGVRLRIPIVLRRVSYIVYYIIIMIRVSKTRRRDLFRGVARIY